MLFAMFVVAIYLIDNIESSRKKKLQFRSSLNHKQIFPGYISTPVYVYFSFKNQAQLGSNANTYGYGKPAVTVGLAGEYSKIPDNHPIITVL